ncbi:branched-chain amino acid ABC transporter ATP-binding protein [Rhodococcus wratislaviensis]|uniref:Branched-chain amino acid ABC transporter ATP-binding protein n=1 Tax=Rhodococcus wratislaviensis TaxID=44752 RepID=A0A402C9N4_RHOWR|nr:ABC transporter ATP-binding protein [Rhodococcus wratislaviensis]GCE40319.1 branched-chain amino acid ABC transporter ATP-binding protein [Rhodococcus wratislaviensis]
MSEQTTTPLLSLRNVQSGYGDLRVVWDVSLDVWPGKVTALLGRNGAGKTSTLRAISGLNRVSAGTIEFDGRDIAKVAPHRRVRQGMAYVQEGKRVFHLQTVEQNLILGGYVRRTRRSAVREEVERIYDLFPVLGAKRGLLAGAMSGGQQQMLAIGQALMAKPTLLLLDEPSGGLAPVIVGEVMERVSTLKEAGLAVLLVEQAVDAAMSVADHVTVLDVGRVVMDADAGAIDDRAVIRDAYFGRVG